MPTKKKSGASDAAGYVSAMNASAERLGEVRKLINTREETFKLETNDLYTEEKKLKEDLLLALKTIGLASVRTSLGETYTISKKNRFNILDPLQLETYARDERCVTIDKKMLNQRFTKALKEGKLPDFVTAEPYETISIRSPKKEGEEETATESG